MDCFSFLLALLIALNFGCERYKSRYKVPVAAPADTGRDAGSEPIPPIIPSKPAVVHEIVLESLKIAGPSPSRDAVVKFAGISSPRIPLQSSATGASFRLPMIPPDNSDVLVVEIYEASKLRFIAKRADTRFRLDQSEMTKIEDCLILSAPWDGTKNDGSCNWAIEEQP